MNQEAVERMAFAAETMEQSMVCPFCGMHWDQAVVERYVLAGDFAGAEAYMNEMLASPLNETGDDYGQRARPEDAE